MRRSAVFVRVRCLSRAHVVLEVADGVGGRAVGVGEAVLLGERADGQGAAVEAGYVRVGCECGDGPGGEEGGLGDPECGVQLGLDAEPQHAPAVVQVAFPHLLAALDEVFRAPDRVDKDVQPSLFPVDTLGQRLYLVRL